MKASSVYEEKVLRCNDCHCEIDKCDDCGRKFHETDSVYCILHTTVDDFNYIHLCKDCVTKKGNDEPKEN